MHAKSVVVYNLWVGIVPSVLKTLKGFAFACYRKEDVVSYATVHCNTIRKEFGCGMQERVRDLKTGQCNFTGCSTSVKSFNLSLSFLLCKRRLMVSSSSFSIVVTTMRY